jgi:hypothetical protein
MTVAEHRAPVRRGHLLRRPPPRALRALARQRDIAAHLTWSVGPSVADWAHRVSNHDEATFTLGDLLDTLRSREMIGQM